MTNSLVADPYARHERVLAALKFACVAMLAILCALWVQISFNAYPSVQAFLGLARFDSAAGDFIGFYAAAKAALAGDPRLAFDIDYISQIAVSISGEELRLPWAYPPTVAMLLTPLGLFAPGAALAAWLVALILAAVAAARLSAGWRWAWLAPLYPGCVLSFACAQNGTVTALLLALFYRYSDRPWMSGAALGLLSYKPQFLPIPLLFLLLERKWKAVAIAAAIGGALAGSSALLYGPGPWVGFAEAMLRQGSLFYANGLQSTRMYSLSAQLIELGYPRAAMMVAPVMALLALAAGWRAWSRGSAVLRALALSAGALLFTPYGYDYDLAVLLLPLCVALRESQDFTPARLGAISCLVLLPMLTMLSKVYLPVQPGGLGLMAFCAVLLATDPWRAGASAPPRLPERAVRAAA
jgi:hypothetical protein